MHRLFIALATMILAATQAASAAVVYSNAPDLSSSQSGDCRYNTTCSAFNGWNGFAAQLFALGSASTITGVSFNSVVGGSGIFATSANWKLIDDDGAGGLPGTVIASGSAPVSHAAGPVGAHSATTDYSFTIAGTALAAGSYYIALQAVTVNGADFLMRGVAGSGAAESLDGGTSWAFLYGDVPKKASVAVTLTSDVDVPEPVSSALLAVALTAVFGLRRSAGARRA